MDDLDELERRCNEAVNEWFGVYKGPDKSLPRMAMPVGEVLALIERCRAAEKERDEWKAKYESTLAGYHAFARENGVEVWRRLYAKVEAERDTAERNLACIADQLNTWARETNQREVTDYLGPCVLRDALKELSGYANKKRYEAESRLARWPEAVEEVRNRFLTNAAVQLTTDEITRLATEKREDRDGTT